MKRILLLPPRFSDLLEANHGRLLRILLMILVFTTALYTKEYKGEYQLIINNHVGGVLYVLFGSLLFSVLFPRVKYYWLITAALAITCVLEFIQYFRFPFMVELTQIKAFAYLFGVSFNPVDFVYYLAGAILSFVVLSAIMLSLPAITQAQIGQAGLPASSGAFQRQAGKVEADTEATDNHPQYTLIG